MFTEHLQGVKVLPKLDSRDTMLREWPGLPRSSWSSWREQQGPGILIKCDKCSASNENKM